MARLRFLSYVFTVLWLLPEPSLAIKTILNGSEGGQCTLIGTWNRETQTCRLNRDLNEGIEIVGNGITLDGGGHALTGNVDSIGIEIHNQVDVRAIDLKLSGFETGVSIEGGSGHRLSGNEIKQSIFAQGGFSGIGILLNNTRQVRVQGNVVENNDGYGIYLLDSDRNAVFENTIADNQEGITLLRSDDNQIYRNTLPGSRNPRSRGVHFNNSSDNYLAENSIKNHLGGEGVLLAGIATGNFLIYNDLEGNNAHGLLVAGPRNKIVCNSFDRHGVRALAFVPGIGGNQVYLNNFDGADNAVDPNLGPVNEYEQNFWQQNQACPDAQPPGGDGICDQPFQFPVRVDPHSRKHRIQWELQRQLCAPVRIPEQDAGDDDGDQDDKPSTEELPGSISPAELNLIRHLRAMGLSTSPQASSRLMELWLPTDYQPEAGSRER